MSGSEAINNCSHDTNSNNWFKSFTAFQFLFMVSAINIMNKHGLSNKVAIYIAMS